MHVGPVIIDDYISKDLSLEITDLLDPLLCSTPRKGMRGALGYETSAIAAQIGYGLDAIQGQEDSATYKSVIELNTLIRSVKAELENYFNIEMGLVNCNYQELTEGGYNPLHSDSTKLDGTPWRDDGVEEELEFSALVYLNNYGVDFTGGEVYFPNQETLITPKAGQLVLFRGDIDHIHEVYPVTSGVRKNLVFFFGRSGNVSATKHFTD